MIAESARGCAPRWSDNFARSEIERPQAGPKGGAQGCAEYKHSRRYVSSDAQARSHLRHDPPPPGVQIKIAAWGVEVLTAAAGSVPPTDDFV